ncbi:hypothetical protein [Lacticaseibacillus absianus]|uniref:hypothetical protein n=1 Tax=Lacticaseibacillus absianus TaxID=2729623 RepID=UPI0015CBAD3F|nr:hypothetical protein [Lacticaseibacillus absianus]
MTEIDLLKAQLTARTQHLIRENQRFFGAIVVYTRMRAFFKDPREVEHSLLEIQADMLDAQADGISAATYFGSEPARTSRDLLRAMPASPHTIRRLVGLASLGYLTAMGLPLLIEPDAQLDLGQLLLMGLAFAVTAIVCSLLLSTLAFAGNRPVMVGLGLLTGAGIGLGISGLALLYPYLATGWRVSTGGWLGLPAILALMAGSLTVYRHAQAHMPRGLAQIFLGLYLTYGCLGLVERIPVIARWLDHDDRLAWAMIIPMGLLYVAMLWHLMIPTLHRLWMMHKGA